MMCTTKNVAIIPARGGSKRIAKKNIKDFHGKPIIEYTIKNALNSKLFEKVVVSTDDMEIAKVSLELGAEVPFMRPPELSDDFSGTNSVVKHALEYYSCIGVEYEFVCCMYATAPLLQLDYLKSGYEALKKGDWDFTYAATEYSFPVQRSVRRDGTMLFPEEVDSRSQDLEPLFHDAAQFYWGGTQSFKADKRVLSSKSLPIVIPRKYVVDIDTAEDWELAQLMFEVLKLT